MPKIENKRQLAVANGYAGLVKNIRKELSNLEFFVRYKTTETYWKIGKFIHTHLLENKQRAGYGHLLYERLAEDVGKDKSTLRRSVQFYLTYPILASRRELSWTQYRQLITIKDDGQRKRLEQQFIQKGLDTRGSQTYLNFKKSQLAVEEEPEEPVAQLSFNRGLLFTYGVVENPDSEDGFLLDLGFRVRKDLPEAKDLKLLKGDCLRASNNNSFIKVSAKKEELFTYKAQVQKIIDGDTLWAIIDAGFGIFIEQKLRLRGIDCAELDTEEGQLAKRFVQKQLRNCDFIVVKTYKDSTDKYDRYLADIFFLEDEKDIYKVAEKGRYLNQELLDESLAYAW